jgi:signal transduction histidine kinase
MTSNECASIPIDALPQPVVRYRVADERPSVAATNDAFDDTFGEVDSGTAVETLLATLRSDDGPESSLSADCLVGGDSVEVPLSTQDGAQTYRLRSRSGEGSEQFLVFSPVVSEQAGGDSVGIGTVASALTHDLRNPLDVAKAHLRAAEETGDTEHFEAVATAHDRMEQLIQDVLTLARGEAVVQPESVVDMTEAVADAWAAVDTQSAELVQADSLPSLTADPGRVRRVFENLFRNAVEHGHRNAPREQGGGEAEPTLTVTVGPLETGGVYVADDGCGIPASEREEVFDLGYTRTEQGTGLGLAIVERIVDAHDWQVSLTDSEAGGARFEIRC